MNDALTAVVLREWEICEPVPGSVLHGQFFQDAATREIARQLDTDGLIAFDELRQGLRVHARSYVGRIRVGSFEITVRPKIDDLPLLQLVRYAYGLRDLKLFTATTFGTSPLALHDLLIEQLASESEELIARGLHRRYERVEASLAYPQGRIDIQRIAREGGIMRAAIPNIYHPRKEDTLLNRVLLAGLRLGTRLTNDPHLRMRLRRMIATMEATVTATMLDRHTFNQAVQSVNRLTSAYRPALTLIGLLLEGQGVSLDAQSKTLSIQGVLFDMQRFFQALLSRFLRENLLEYLVKDEYRLTHMMRYVAKYNPRHRQTPTPRPDYVIQKDGQIAAMLDAKYRDLWERDLPRDMLYQLAMYALSQASGRTATILYPTTHGAAREARIEIRDPLYGHGTAWVNLRPVPLQNIADCVSQPSSIAKTQQSRALAYTLAFGESLTKS